MLELLPEGSKAVDSVEISAVVVIEVLSEVVDSVEISAVVVIEALSEVVDSVSDGIPLV